MGGVYVLSVDDVHDVYRVLRKLRKNKAVRVHTVLIIVSCDDPRVLGGFKSGYGAELRKAIVVLT